MYGLGKHTACAHCTSLSGTPLNNSMGNTLGHLSTPLWGTLSCNSMGDTWPLPLVSHTKDPFAVFCPIDDVINLYPNQPLADLSVAI